MQKHVNLVDLVKKIITSIYYLLAKIDVGKAENEPEYGYGISLIFVSLIFGPALPSRELGSSLSSVDPSSRAKKSQIGVKPAKWPAPCCTSRE